MKRNYFVKKGYTVRSKNAPYVDFQSDGTVYQPDVYELAEFLAKRSGCEYIIDIGAGNGEKLAPYEKSFKLIAIDCDTNIKILRKNLKDSEVIEYDLEKGLPTISPDILKKAVVLSSDVIEHIVEPHKYMKCLAQIAKISPFVLVSTPDRTRARGPEDFGPPGNPFHVREWTIDELYQLFLSYSIPTSIGFTISNDLDFLKGTILAVFGTHATYSETPLTKRVLAIMTSYNEEDIIESSITHLLDQGTDVHVIDNWSSDRTYKIVAKLAKDNPRITFERYPVKEPTVHVYEWEKLLHRVEEVAIKSDYDWIIHNDADELRVSSWKNVPLLMGINFADSLGYNSIDFTVLDFRPIKDGFNAKVHPGNFFFNFEFTPHASYLQQVKCWKNSKEIDLASSGGHIAKIPDQKIFPMKFISKHYPLRSTKQAEKKIFNDRKGKLSSEEIKRGWHTQYDAYTQDSNFIWNEKYLNKFTNGNFYTDFIVERISGIGVLGRHK